MANTVDALRREKQELELAYAELVQRAFRNRSERYLDHPNQLLLDLGGSDDAADAAEGLAQAVNESEQPVQAHVRRRQGRKPRTEALPENLPRYEVEARVPKDIRHCRQHGERTLIGYDSVETLEFERPKLRVRVTKYPKYTGRVLKLRFFELAGARRISGTRSRGRAPSNKAFRGEPRVQTLQEPQHVPA